MGRRQKGRRPAAGVAPALDGALSMLLLRRRLCVVAPGPALCAVCMTLRSAKRPACGADLWDRAEEGGVCLANRNIQEFLLSHAMHNLNIACKKGASPCTSPTVPFWRCTKASHRLRIVATHLPVSLPKGLPRMAAAMMRLSAGLARPLAGVSRRAVNLLSRSSSRQQVRAPCCGALRTIVQASAAPGGASATATAAADAVPAPQKQQKQKQKQQQQQQHVSERHCIMHACGFMLLPSLHSALRKERWHGGFRVHACCAPPPYICTPTFIMQQKEKEPPPSLVDLPTSDESDELLRIRHSVSTRKEQAGEFSGSECLRPHATLCILLLPLCAHSSTQSPGTPHCLPPAVCSHYGHGSAAVAQRRTGGCKDPDEPAMQPGFVPASRTALRLSVC